MVHEIMNAFENNWSKDNLTLKLPDIFQEIATRDDSEKMELVVSNTLQPLNLIYSWNFTSKDSTIAYIFVSSRCKGIPNYDYE